MQRARTFRFLELTLVAMLLPTTAKGQTVDNLPRIEATSGQTPTANNAGIWCLGASIGERSLDFFGQRHAFSGGALGNQLPLIKWTWKYASQIGSSTAIREDRLFPESLTQALDNWRISFIPSISLRQGQRYAHHLSALPGPN